MNKSCLLALSLSATLALAATGAQAASLTQPGLWDLTMKTEYRKGGPQMSAQELAMMKQIGIDPFNMKMQRCITPEQAREEFDPSTFSDENSGCKVANPKRSGGRLSGDYVCNGQLKGRGLIEAEASSTAFTSHFTFVGTSEDPQMGSGAIDLRTDISGRFVKADCGSAGRPGIPGRPGGFQMPGQR